MRSCLSLGYCTYIANMNRKYTLKSSFLAGMNDPDIMIMARYGLRVKIWETGSIGYHRCSSFLETLNLETTVFDCGVPKNELIPILNPLQNMFSSLVGCYRIRASGKHGWPALCFVSWKMRDSSCMHMENGDLSIILQYLCNYPVEKCGKWICFLFIPWNREVFMN